jgi:hypothetical protein
VIEYRKALCAATWCWIGATWTAAQQPASRPADAAPADPREAVTAMVEALHNTNSYAFKIRSESKGGGKTIESCTADVRYRRGEDRPAIFSAIGRTTLPTKFSFSAAIDGDDLLVLDLDRKVFEKSPWSPDLAAAAGFPSDAGNGAFEAVRSSLPLVFAAPGFALLQAGDTAKLVGTESVGGVPCDVVEVEQVREVTVDAGGGGRPIKSKSTSKWWIGRADRLPRKWRSVMPSLFGEMGRAEDLGEIENLVVGAEMEAKPTSLEGFKPGRVGGAAASTGAGPGDSGGFGTGRGPSIGDLAKDFAVKDASGKEHRLSKYKAKAVLVNFSPAEDSPSDDFLAAIKKRYSDKLVVLDLVVGGEAAALKKKKDLGFFRCVAGDVAVEWNVGVTPFAYFVGTDGKIGGRMPSGVGAGPRGAGAKALVDEMHPRLNAWLKDPKIPFTGD